MQEHDSVIVYRSIHEKEMDEFMHQYFESNPEAALWLFGIIGAVFILGLIAIIGRSIHARSSYLKPKKWMDKNLWRK